MMAVNPSTWVPGVRLPLPALPAGMASVTAPPHRGVAVFGIWEVRIVCAAAAVTRSLVTCIGVAGEADVESLPRLEKPGERSGFSVARRDFTEPDWLAVYGETASTTNFVPWRSV
jgi:hypothetical protein